MNRPFEERSIMAGIIIGLISTVIISIVLQFFGGDLITEMMNVAPDLGNHIPDTTNPAMVTAMFSSLTTIFYNLGLSLPVLKFLTKGFGIYSLWTDGDPEADPCGYLVNFIKAIAMATGFKYIYEFAVSVCTKLLTDILKSVNDTSGGDTWTKIAGSIGSLNILMAVLNLMFFIGLLILYFKFIMRGLEMLILKIGVPIACIGLLDNDGGIFREYSMQFVKAIFTTLIQCTLAKLGMWFMASDMNAVMAIVCMAGAHGVPKMLQFILLQVGGGGNAMNTAYQGSMIASQISRIKLPIK
jgi:hypothetical protein